MGFGGAYMMVVGGMYILVHMALLFAAAFSEYQDDVWDFLRMGL